MRTFRRIEDYSCRRLSLFSTGDASSLLGLEKPEKSFQKFDIYFPSTLKFGGGTGVSFQFFFIKILNTERKARVKKTVFR